MIGSETTCAYQRSDFFDAEKAAFDACSARKRGLTSQSKRMADWRNLPLRKLPI
jgi:hypothetical protein